MPKHRTLKRAAAGLTAALLVATTLAVAGPAAGAATQDPADDALLPTGALMQCADKQGILVATDAQAQSDVYAAVVLAGVIDGCLVPAGHRDAPDLPPQGAINALQASSIAYIIGSTAAVPEAKVVDASAENATRLGGPDRFATAQLVGVEALKIAEASAEEAAEESTPSEPAEVAASTDLGALTASRSHTAPAGQTDVTATLSEGRWRITAQSQVPAGKRIDTGFVPRLTVDTACFEDDTDPGDRTDRHQFMWDTKSDPDGDCDDAENREVTVSLSAGDLSDFSDPDSDAAVWGWTVKFERRPAVNVPSPTSVTATTRETLTPTVTVPADDSESRQLIRLGQGAWLLHVIDQAAGGLGGGTAVPIVAGHKVTISDVAEVYLSAEYDDAARYDTDRYRCVVKATSAHVVADGLTARYKGGTPEGANVVAPAGGDKYTVSGDTAIALNAAHPSAVVDSAVVSVPRGCAGYVAVELAAPDAGTTGAGNDDDDVSRWRVQAIPLAPPAAS